MITVVDYGAGNLRSIRRALEAAGAAVTVSSRPADIEAADAVVLPGVGAAGAAMDRLHDLGLIEPITATARDGKPLLGICLGMQLMFGPQEEGDTVGLGLLPGRVRSIQAPVKVPHIGWNRARVVRDGPLGRIGAEYDYYFVHSYVVDLDDPADAQAETVYGGTFPSVVVRNNLWGTQFHPEKSGDRGLELMKSFVSQTVANAGLTR